MSSVKVAALQMRAGTDVAKNVEIFDAMVRQAARAGLKSEADDIVSARARKLAGELGVHVHVGSTAIGRADGKVANRAFLFGPDGALISTYDKLHMFDVDLDNGESWRESATYEPGREAIVADLPFGRLGFAVCYDLRFPQLFRAEAMAGADILTVPAAFTRQTGEAHWHVLLRARAIENGAWLVAAAQGGKHEDGRETYGHSMIIDPWGRIVAEANHDNPEVVLAEIDIAAVKEARGKVPNLRNAREFDLRHVASELERTVA